MQWVVVTIGVLCGVYVCCVGGCVLIVCPKFLVCGILDACFIYLCLCVCVYVCLMCRVYDCNVYAMGLFVFLYDGLCVSVCCVGGCAHCVSQIVGSKCLFISLCEWV